MTKKDAEFYVNALDQLRDAQRRYVAELEGILTDLGQEPQDAVVEMIHGAETSMTNAARVFYTNGILIRRRPITSSED